MGGGWWNQFSSVEFFSSRWYLCARESAHALHPVSGIFGANVAVETIPMSPERCFRWLDCHERGPVSGLLGHERGAVNGLLGHQRGALTVMLQT